MNKQWAWPNDEVALKYAAPVAAFLLALLILLLVRHLTRKWLFRHSREEASFGRIVLDTLRVPSILWCLAAAMQFGLELSFIPPKYTLRASNAILAFIIISICMVLASAAVRALTMHGRRRGIAVASAGLAQTLIRVFIFTAGAAAVLAIYKVNITPLLTALGVGGLAVALALQDTLANLFAGIHILIEEPISLGAHMRLSSGEEGVVTDIGWRTTRVRNAGNNMVVIPNTKITSGILTNFNLPEERQAVDVAVMVGYSADVDQVRRIALEEARGCELAMRNPEPVVFFNPGVTPTHLQFTAVFHVSEFAKRGPALSDVRMRIYRRLRAEGVPPPGPDELKIPAAD